MEIYILSIVLGLVVGSFLNVVIYRTEKDKGVGGRSYCPKCKKQIPWYDNIPLLSYLLLGGKCRFCHKKISAQYPLVEMLAALTFLGSAYLVINNLINDWLGHYFSLTGLLTIGASLGANVSLITFDQSLKLFEIIFIFLISSALITIIVYDLKHMLIPDSFTLAGIIIALVYAVVVDILLFFAAIIPKNELLILEVNGLAGKYQPSGLLPMGLSSYLGWEPNNFYALMVHFKENLSALLTGSHLGSGLIAGLVAAGVFFLVVYLSQETWMGMGDVKLVFFLGLLLGMFKTAVALFLAFELGAVLGVALILLGRAKMKTALPFGPFLIIGAALSLLFI